MMISVLLLAGGRGTRFGAALPKQFLPLQERAVVLHSLEVLRTLPNVGEVIVVVDPAFRTFFPSGVRFALPGQRRQDSVYHGLLASNSTFPWALIHDAARPFISTALCCELLASQAAYRAATLAVPLKATIKEGTGSGVVARTLDRSRLWEIQTPQLLHKETLHAGFKKAVEAQLTVTDDVALAELVQEPVRLVPGRYTNLKITTPEDLALAEFYLQKGLI